MNNPSLFSLSQYQFSLNLFDEFHTNHYANDLWPIVYILSSGGNIQDKVAYVGETADAYSRMKTHLKNSQKNQLTSVHIITSEKFNKSATLDIESNLIKYISGDGKYKLLNGNLGLANHNYFQKHEIYWDIFISIWNALRAEGVTEHSLGHIDNSDLFKYSPYKNLTNEQRSGLFEIMTSLLSDESKNIIVEGGAGTGKTILAIFLFKILHSDNDGFNFKEFGDDESNFIPLISELRIKYTRPKMALVVPMSSFRETLKKVYKNIKGLKANMVISPAEASKNKYDILVVDESHRLRKRTNLGTYFGAFDKACERLRLDTSTCSELDWIILQSNKTVLFYDQNQSIKPSDANKEGFANLKKLKQSKTLGLKSQFRVRGGNAYVDFIHKLLDSNSKNNSGEFKSEVYEFLLFDSIEDMICQIKLRNKENGLSRLIAGYSWEWISKKDESAFDIKIEDVQLKWNSTPNDWINSENSINEVGCIHTTQGYDLNYAGIIFGNEISYDKDNDEIVILKENYFDKNGKQSIHDPNELKRFIINIYKTILLRGIKGTYVYVCDKDLKNYFSKYIPKTASSKKEIELLPLKKIISFKNCIPLYDLKKIAEGNFVDRQHQDHIDWLTIPSGYKPSKDLFACKVLGESMNKVIANGSICLFRAYSGGDINGKIALVEHTNIQDPDFCSCYTIKEYQSSKAKGERVEHEYIVLKPLSYNSGYEDLVLDSHYRVIGTFECVL